MKSAKRIAAALTALALASTYAAEVDAATDYKLRIVSKGLKGAKQPPAAPGGTTPPVQPPMQPPVQPPVQPPQPVDVSSSVSISVGGWAINRLTGVYKGTVYITNTSGQTLSGTFQYATADLPGSVTLINGVGTLNGAPVVTYTGTIAPDERITLVTEFSNPEKRNFIYTPKWYKGSL